MAKKFKINASDGSIKRYSDVVPQEKRRYWYFTTHGIGPGMLPSDVKILETKEGQNKKGTWGDFICLDSVLNTDELKAYDLIELAPDMVESACGKKKSVKSATRKPLRKQAIKASAKKAIEASDYITEQLIQNTNSKPLKDAYDNGDLSVVMKDDVFWFEHTPSDRIAKLATKEIKRLYPNAKSLLEVGPKKPVKSSTKRRAVKASDVDADRPNSAPNSWKSSQRMAYKVTDEDTKGEKSFPTDIDDVYKALGEMQGTWTNPTTGWTGDCEIFERDLDDGSYIFSLVFGGNELEPDDILYDPNGFNYYSNKPKFTIYPHSGAPTFADSLEDFKRKLKKEYSYLRKVDDVKSSKTVKASAVAKYKAVKAAKDGRLDDLQFVMSKYIDGNHGCKLVKDYGNGTFDVDYQGTEVTLDFDLDDPTKFVYTINNEGPYAHSSYEFITRDIEEYVDSITDEWGNIKATKKAVKCSVGKVYYQITDDYYNVIDVAATEEEATALAEKLLRENNEDHYDIWYVDENEDSDSDDSFITTVYADKPFIVEGYYGADFRGLADSDTFYELSDAIDYAHELLSKGDFVTMEYIGGAGGTLRISPDEYFENFDGEFACTPEIAEWQNAVWKSMGIGASTKAIKANDGIAPDDYDSVDDMVSDGVQYDSTFDSSINDAVYSYINDNYNVYISDVEYVEYTNPENWVVDCYQGSNAVESDFVWFVENNNTEIYNKLFYPKEYIEDPEMQAISDKLADTYAAENAIICNDFHVSFYPQNGQYSAPQVYLYEAELEKLGFTHDEYLELVDLVAQYENYCIEAYKEINYRIGSFLEELANEEVPIESSTKAIKASTSNGLERAKQNILEYLNNETYLGGDPVRDSSLGMDYFDGRDMRKFPILYTTIGETEEYDYQLYIDFIDPKVIVEVDGNVVYEDKFPNIDALADDLEDFDWDNWYSYYLDYVPDEYVFGSCNAKIKAVKASNDADLSQRIYEFLDEEGGYTDYNQKIEDVVEEFGISKELAESYVWDWSSGLNTLNDPNEDTEEAGFNLYGYDINGEDVSTTHAETEAEVLDVVAYLFGYPEVDTVDVYEGGMSGYGDFYKVYTRDEFEASEGIEATTGVNADLQLNKNASDRKKYNWGKNPITDLDGYVKDIADGVVERFPNLTYEISDEAITFTNNESGEVVYIQSIDEIVPEKEDLENDTEELSNAIQHEQEEADWYNQNSDAVEMSTYDDELEPIMGDGFNEDMGFGFDSNGEALTESTVDELRRIANEILQKSELAKIDPYTSIDEDTFKYYASSPHVEEEFYIYFNLTLSGQELYDMDVLEFDDDRTLGWSINKDYEFECDIVVKNGEVKSIIWVDVPEEQLFEATADYNVLDDYVTKLASPVAMDIYNGTTNI